MAAETLDEPAREGEFLELTDKISRERGFRCANYKDKCLRRRIAVRMRARGVEGYGAYAALLDEDAREFDQLIDALTINVTKFFRNPDVFDAIAREIVAPLWDRTFDSRIDVWSAGTASGEEAYSLAALFHQHADTVGELARIERVRVLGTDIDRRSLDAATRGAYAETAFSDSPAALRQRYFSTAPPYAVAEELRRMVTFARHDLLHEARPGPPVDLLVCRNVLIYLDRDAQERLFRLFAASIVPGGTLVLGKVETLFGPMRTSFATVDPRARIFRRV